MTWTGRVAVWVPAIIASPLRRATPDVPTSFQYSPLITKYEPRMVPASTDFCFANLNLDATSGGTSIPSESLKSGDTITLALPSVGRGFLPTQLDPHRE